LVDDLPSGKAHFSSLVTNSRYFSEIQLYALTLPRHTYKNKSSQISRLLPIQRQSDKTALNPAEQDKAHIKKVRRVKTAQKIFQNSSFIMVVF
jgi:hypothetical protein